MSVIGFDKRSDSGAPLRMRERNFDEHAKTSLVGFRGKYEASRVGWLMGNTLKNTSSFYGYYVEDCSMMWQI
jgi:hypothetical protein